MLTHLSIRALTLVDQLELEFGSGMSVITGETGAGKSILLGALALALGDRADSSLIAAGEGKTEINASFDLSDNPEALQWLSERELLEAEQCILRRVVSKDGRSRAFINGSTTTLTELKSLSEMLLDIHSQHEHQSLLKKDTHRKLLDDFGGLTDVVSDVSDRFALVSALAAQLKKIRDDAQEQTARVQLLSYQVQELAELALDTGETAVLAIEQKRLQAADSIQGTLAEVANLCAKENDATASSQTSHAIALLSEIEDESIVPIAEMLASAQIQIDEAMADLASSMDKFESDPTRLREVEDRLSKIYETARKHKVQPDDLPALTDQLQTELNDLVNVDAKVAELTAQLANAQLHYQGLADKLSQSRQKTAQLLESEVTEQLQNLGMDGAVFKSNVGISEQPNRFGTNDIEFLIATIPGSTPSALNRIASGGELSRISLAIQVITAKTSKTPTLIFDEVDVGIGGGTAEVVGGLLRRLGADAQIICVTHLPQVAAQGHHHYVVTKATTSEGASTDVTRLGEEQKVDEIARMLGGLERTDQSIAHAEAMIKGSH